MRLCNQKIVKNFVIFMVFLTLTLWHKCFCKKPFYTLEYIYM